MFNNDLAVYYYDNMPINRVLVVGLGVSGVSVMDFFKSYAVVVDTMDVAIFTGGDNHMRGIHEADLCSYDLIVVSPGVPINKKPYNVIYEYWDKVVCDIEIFSMEIAKIENKKIIAITGSNGKSTSVTLLSHLLLRCDISACVAGNIGVPVLEALKKDADIYILELSSFQIDLLKKSKFNLGCILNVTEDHLDRYADFSSYKQSKRKLLDHCHCKIINTLDNWVESDFIKFNNKYNYVDDSGRVFLNGKLLVEGRHLQVTGRHNYQNILAVSCIIDAMGLDALSFKSHFLSYKGLDHRCCEVANINGVAFYNDSKATNVGSVISSISGLTDTSNIRLLMGGISKGADFSLLNKYLGMNIVKLYLYGQDRHVILKDLTEVSDFSLFETLGEAFYFASCDASQGELVLLAPGCSSFDAFSGYEERGDYFENLVNQLKES